MDTLRMYTTKQDHIILKKSTISYKLANDICKQIHKCTV